MGACCLPQPTNVEPSTAPAPYTNCLLLIELISLCISDFFTNSQPNNTLIASITPASSCACHSGTAIQDTGFYLGGSVGDTTLEAEFDDPIGDGTFTFNESDFSWKAFGGVNYEAPASNPLSRLGI